MANRIYIVLLLLWAFLLCCQAGSDKPAPAPETVVRPPTVAGQFYSANAERLELGIRNYLADAVPVKVEKPVGIVVPHAGYIYSGQICADGFNQAKNQVYDIIVILGTNHTTAGFTGVSIYAKGAFKTPLGTTDIDEPLAETLLGLDENYTFNKSVHTEEHSVEVELPFVQVLFPGVKILPVVIGAPDLKLCVKFGNDLAAVLKDRNPLIVASSDLSHYPSYQDAVETDRATLEAIACCEAEQVHRATEGQMSKGVGNLSTCACGEGPIMACITASKALGANNAAIISYANSGLVAIGDIDRVVGYGAVAFSKTPALEPPDPWYIIQSKPLPTPIPTFEKKQLLALARKTIRWYLESETLPLPRDCSPMLSTPRGAFVTLNKHGELRGCIGHMAEDTPLKSVIGQMAIQSAFNDRRFSPVQMEEVDDLEIEISVLTPYQKVSSAEDIVIGRDGVLIRKNNRSAVFLPQVATEQGWTREETLDHLCEKAGLPSDAWHSGTEFFVFQAEVFHEGEFK